VKSKLFPHSGKQIQSNVNTRRIEKSLANRPQPM